jgi:hypothetical protein
MVGISTAFGAAILRKVIAFQSKDKHLTGVKSRPFLIKNQRETRRRISPI